MQLRYHFVLWRAACALQQITGTAKIQKSIAPDSRNSRGNSLALHYQFSFQSHPAPWVTLLTFQATHTIYLSTLWAKCNPIYDKLSCCCLWALRFQVFLFLVKYFLSPFSTGAKLKGWAEPEVSAINLNTVKKMIGHLVYAALITWASYWFHGCSSTGFTALCLFMRTFFLPHSRPLCGKDAAAHAPAPCPVPNLILSTSLLMPRIFAHCRGLLALKSLPRSFF